MAIDTISTTLGMYDEKVELTLLAYWGDGYHKEDIYHFEEALFTRKKMLKGIKEGKKLFDLLANEQLENCNYAELLTIRNDDILDGDYKNAKATALNAQLKYITEKLSDPSTENKTEWLEKYRMTEAVLHDEDFKPLARDYAENFLKELKEVIEEENPHYGRGLEFIDKYTRGLHRGELTVIGARPRKGKSAIALQIAYNVAVRQGFKTIFLPLEMSVNSCLERLLLQNQVVDTDYREDLTEEIEASITGVLNMIEENLLFAPNLNKLSDIERIIKEERPYLIIIDQLSQIKGTKKKDLRESYIEITRFLKRLALDNNVAIILLSQINRATAESKNPGIEALADSDSIGQDADNVLILHTNKKDDDEEEDPEARFRKTYLAIAKQRNGICGKTITLMYEGARFTFSAVDTSGRYDK